MTASGPPRLGERFEQALVYAAHLHSGQIRKGSETPYIAHLLSVAALVIESGGTEDQAIAGLLHDSLEDQSEKKPRETIRQRFGDNVLRLVEGCTDTEVLPKPPWRARKEAYLAHLRHAPSDVQLISLADKIHNARAIVADLRVLGDGVWSRFTGGKDGSLWYYKGLSEIFGQIHPGPQADDLKRVVAQMTTLSAPSTP